MVMLFFRNRTTPYVFERSVNGEARRARSFAADLDRAYVVGDLEDHENLRRAISEVKIQLKAIEVKIQEKLRSKSVRTLYTSTCSPPISPPRPHTRLTHRSSGSSTV